MAFALQAYTARAGAGVAGQRLAVGPCPGSQRRLVVDVKRRPVGQRQLRERDAADTQPPRLDGGRVGEH